ncbi:hypothetical protein B0J11DRAFT_573958 [Dendryphion nanum]|uniref:Uncharacterized protein n=1 Tax=Dendryphion nanum TaxID=256645 RepID=A0A9P9IY16_9PLEO|nr:hypothetical protein B0J11DRAFT_573958 [Dendryphion nanum]
MPSLLPFCYLLSLLVGLAAATPRPEQSPPLPTTLTTQTPPKPTEVLGPVPTDAPNFSIQIVLTVDRNKNNLREWRAYGTAFGKTADLPCSGNYHKGGPTDGEQGTIEAPNFPANYSILAPNVTNTRKFFIRADQILGGMTYNAVYRNTIDEYTIPIKNPAGQLRVEFHDSIKGDKPGAAYLPFIVDCKADKEKDIPGAVYPRENEQNECEAPANIRYHRVAVCDYFIKEVPNPNA